MFKNHKALMILRGKPPSQGLWSIPGGSVELGETLQQAAEREVFEETGVIVSAKEPVYTFDHIEKDENERVRFHYVIIDLTADYVSGEPVPGDDALDARWVSLEELDELDELQVSERLRKLLVRLG